MIDDMKEYMKEYNKKYYATNKTKLLEDAVKQILCNKCNCMVSKSNISKHMKTDKHKLNLRIKELEQ